MSDLMHSVSTLLRDVKRLQKHQREIERIKGETFNIFSILGVESKENRTHSNFIAELLNPKGSHYMGSVFLQAFLEQIEYNGKLDVNTAYVQTEKHIAKRTNITGGRIDIFIKDKVGNYIFIENKIYAGDQENQLIRYFKYKEGFNKLYYLTLFGDEASEYSTRCTIDNETFELKCEEDYHPISYQTHILQWLEECQRIAVDVPQLREAIKQYILLIKKLTNQMIDPKDLELKKILFENAEAAQYVADNFENVKIQIKINFRSAVESKLKNILYKDNYEVSAPNPIKKTGIAQIFINLPKIRNANFFYTIESFSDNGHHNGALFIGLLDSKATEKDFPIIDEKIDFNLEYWKYAKFIRSSNKEKIYLKDINILKTLLNPDSNAYKALVESVVNQIVAFIEKTYPITVQYFKEEKINPLG